MKSPGRASLALLFSTLCLLASPLASAGFQAGDDSADTREFLSLAPQAPARDGSIDRSRLGSFRVLLVPGLITDVTERIGVLTRSLRLTPTEGFLSSFYQQRNWMAANGIDFEMAPINRAGSCDENGDAIAEAIASSSKKVIIVTQSKGGVDTLYALIRHPEVRAKVAGWVAYQPPHAGSVLADIIQDHSTLSGPSGLLLRLLGGTALAYKDMSTRTRSDYNLANTFEIIGITRSIPIVTLVTTEEPARLTTYLFGDHSESAFLGPFVKTITDRDHDGGMNDGIASVRGTCLDRTACVFLEGIDHFDSVMNTAPFKSLSEEDRVTLFRTLVEMLLNRIGS